MLRQQHRVSSWAGLEPVCARAGVLFRCDHGAPQELHSRVPVPPRDSGSGVWGPLEPLLPLVTASHVANGCGFRTAPVSKAPTVAVSSTGDGTGRGTRSSRGAGAGRKRRTLVVIGAPSTSTCVSPCSTCAAGRLVNCSQARCYGTSLVSL